MRSKRSSSSERQPLVRQPGREGKIRAGRHSFATRLTKLRRKRKGKKGYEDKRENRAVGSGGVHFALASRRAESSFAFVFSRAQVHLGARGTGPTVFARCPAAWS